MDIPSWLGRNRWEMVSQQGHKFELIDDDNHGKTWAWWLKFEFP